MNVKDNIWKFGIYSFIDHIRFIWMISTLYLLWLGFSFTNIGIHETIFALVIVLFELPMGALADLIGKKKAIIISCVLNAIGFTAIGFMNLPMHYYMIALIMGIAFSLVSGADVALLYDSVKKINQTKNYKKIRGKINTFNQIASIIGVFLGPFLYTINPRLGFQLTGIIYLFAAIVMGTTVEPYKTHKKASLKTHWKQTINGFKIATKHKKIMWLIAFFFLSTIGIEFFFDFWQQPLLVNNGFDVKVFGIIFAVMMGIRGLVSWFTHKIEDKLKETGSLLFILLTQVIIFVVFSINNPLTLLISFGAFYAVMAFQEIIFEDYINSHISSSNRATILSVKSLIYNLITASLYVTLGKFMDLYSINKVLICVAVLILIGTFILFMFKNTTINNSSAS